MRWLEMTPPKFASIFVDVLTVRVQRKTLQSPTESANRYERQGYAKNSPHRARHREDEHDGGRSKERRGDDEGEQRAERPAGRAKRSAHKTTKGELAIGCGDRDFNRRHSRRRGGRGRIRKDLNVPSPTRKLLSGRRRISSHRDHCARSMSSAPGAVVDLRYASRPRVLPCERFRRALRSPWRVFALLAPSCFPPARHR